MANDTKLAKKPTFLKSLIIIMMGFLFFMISFELLNASFTIPALAVFLFAIYAFAFVMRRESDPK